MQALLHDVMMVEYKTPNKNSDLHLYVLVITGCGSQPVNEVVLFQIAAAESDVPGHLQQLPH